MLEMVTIIGPFTFFASGYVSKVVCFFEILFDKIGFLAKTWLILRLLWVMVYFFIQF
jgi:hypothetical protein